MWILFIHIIMANKIIEKNWKIFLKCKECWEFKGLSEQNWYKHPQWFMWVLGRCKDCIKKWRHTEHELSMARVRDKKRWENDSKRREYIAKHNADRNRIKKYWKIHLKTSRLIKRLWIRPVVCPICWRNSRIYAHHPDYNKRYEVVFVCMQCHSKIHSWEIECPAPLKLLPF